MGLEFVYLEDVIVFWAWPYILQLFSDDQIQIESLIDGVYSFKFMISLSLVQSKSYAL